MANNVLRLFLIIQIELFDDIQIYKTLGIMQPYFRILLKCQLLP